MAEGVYRDGQNVWVKRPRKGLTMLSEEAYDSSSPPIAFKELPTKDEFEHLGRGVRFGE